MGKKKYNQYDLSGEYGIGWTNNTNQEFYFDLEDYDKIKDYCWGEHILTNGYHALEARDASTNKIVRFNWLIVGKYYDHINRNTLDNRKNNLRSANKSENGANSKVPKNNVSGIIGVSWMTRDRCWRAKLTKDNQIVLLKYFQNKNDAIKARLNAEMKYFKEFAPQRDLFEKYGIIDNNGGGTQ